MNKAMIKDFLAAFPSYVKVKNLNAKMLGCKDQQIKSDLKREIKEMWKKEPLEGYVSKRNMFEKYRPEGGTGKLCRIKIEPLRNKIYADDPMAPVDSKDKTMLIPLDTAFTFMAEFARKKFDKED